MVAAGVFLVARVYPLMEVTPANVAQASSLRVHAASVPRVENVAGIQAEQTLTLALSLSENWSVPTSRTAGHRDRFVCIERLLLCCPEGTNENSPAFQRWVGRQKVASPVGTTEAQSHAKTFSPPLRDLCARRDVSRR